jgi:hypothetical protein
MAPRFLTSPLDGGERSAPRPGPFIPGERALAALILSVTFPLQFSQQKRLTRGFLDVSSIA